MLVKRNLKQLFSAELTHTKDNCPFLENGLCFAHEELSEGTACHGGPCTVHLTIRKDRLSDHAKWLCDIFANTDAQGFAAALCADGCNMATAQEARELCDTGEFEAAANHAHAGGWL